MKLRIIGVLAVALVVGGSLSCSVPHFAVAIQASDAVGVLTHIKKIDRASLEIASETAQEVLKERSQLSRTGLEWFLGISSMLGLVGAILMRNPLIALFRKSKDDALRESPFEVATFASACTSIICVSVAYRWWWKSPSLRLDRAKLIADAFDRELGVTRDPCKS